MEGGKRFGLTKEAADGLCRLLNGCLANTLELYLQTKGAHWNVRGRQFYSWHLLFDHVAGHLQKQSDRLGERVATLGGKAEGTAREVVANSAIREYPPALTDGGDHIVALAERMSAHAALLRGAVTRAREEFGDAVSENVLLEIAEQVEMDTWFLDSHRYEKVEAAEATAPRREAA